MRSKLIELRKKKGYTQKEMADNLKIARSTYAGYESGNFYPSLRIASEIKRILKYGKDDLI